MKSGEKVTEEQLLVDRARRGEKEAFRELVERSKNTVFRMAFDLTGNRHDAEDLSQETYIRAYRALDGFRGGSKWTTWLYRIMVNLSHDRWRKESHRKVDYFDATEEHTAPMTMQSTDTATHPGDLAEAAVIQEQIAKALDALSPQERRVFVLRHYHHLQLNEIAATLAVAEGTVKSLLFRAIRSLQKELSHYRPELGLEEAS